MSANFVFAGNQFVLPNCQQLPPMDSPESKDCVRIGIPRPVTATNSKSLLILMSSVFNIHADLCDLMDAAGSLLTVPICYTELKNTFCMVRQVMES